MSGNVAGVLFVVVVSLCLLAGVLVDDRESTCDDSLGGYVLCDGR